MKIVVLGSAAGGGFPQWNCRCGICELFWSGDNRVVRRTQSSIAVSLDDTSWTLFNCSPDMREQITANPELWPTGRRSTPIASVVLTNGDVDHIGGLISLREQAPFELIATPEIHRIIAENRVFDVLSPGLVRRTARTSGETFAMPGGLEAQFVTVPGKVPLYLEGADPKTAARSGNTVGIAFGPAGRLRALYVPGCATIDEELAAVLAKAELVLFDGTLWQDDEMLKEGVGDKTGRRMGHMPVSGAGGSLEALTAIGVPRVVYIHMNNTNPMLVAGSAERVAIESTGYAVGYDGMEIDC
ncbi:MAG: pyrroloquinoline quinone biosynthesis protein PqqB [Aestuariivirgaceae bacterium]